MADADEAFTPSLCEDPYPMLAAVIGVFEASAASEHLSEGDRDRVDDASRYLAERLATVSAIAAPGVPTVNWTDPLPRGDDGRRRRP